MSYQVDFFHYWSDKKYLVILGYGLKNLLANQSAEFFTFDLFGMLILIPGVHCYIVLFWIITGLCVIFFRFAKQK